MRIKKSKRKYEKKLFPKLAAHKDFITSHLQKEWDALERATRREDMVRAVKNGAAAIGKSVGWSILALALLAGTCVIAAVAPNIVGAIGRFGGGRKRRTYLPRTHFEKELAYFRRRKYVNVTALENQEDGEYKIRLTERGEQYISQRILGEMKIPLQEKWDGVWRVFIFDVPNSCKTARDGLRSRLKAMGFYSLQKSVFVFPYPCRAELQFICSLYNVGDYVRFLETTVLVHDDDARRYFSLI